MASSSTPTSQTGSTATVGSGSGRPADPIWQYYDRIPPLGSSATTVYGKCKDCKHKQIVRSIATLYDHSLIQCRTPKPETRAAVEILQAAKAEKETAKGLPPLGPRAQGLGNKKRKGQQSLDQHFDTGRLTTSAQAALDKAICLMFVMCNIPFQVVTSPWFVRFVELLRPNYQLPGIARHLVLYIVCKPAQV